MHSIHTSWKGRTMSTFCTMKLTNWSSSWPCFCVVLFLYRDCCVVPKCLGSRCFWFYICNASFKLFDLIWVHCPYATTYNILCICSPMKLERHVGREELWLWRPCIQITYTHAKLLLLTRGKERGTQMRSMLHLKYGMEVIVDSCSHVRRYLYCVTVWNGRLAACLISLARSM
jgi:hypothetical protein